MKYLKLNYLLLGRISLRITLPFQFPDGHKALKSGPRQNKSPLLCFLPSGGWLPWQPSKGERDVEGTSTAIQTYLLSAIGKDVGVSRLVIGQPKNALVCIRCSYFPLGQKKLDF